MKTLSFGDSQYFITFLDDYTCYCQTYILKKKSEALEKFKEFKTSAEVVLGIKIKAFRTDRDGECLSGLT